MSGIGLKKTIFEKPPKKPSPKPKPSGESSSTLEECLKNDCAIKPPKDKLKGWAAALICCNVVPNVGRADPCKCGKADGAPVGSKERPCYDGTSPTKLPNPSKECLDCCGWLACVFGVSKIGFGIGIDALKDVVTEGGKGYLHCQQCCDAKANK